MPHFTVIIPNHNDYSEASKLTTLLANFPYPPSNIIIVSASKHHGKSTKSYNLNSSSVYEIYSEKGRGIQLNRGVEFYQNHLSEEMKINKRSKHYYLFLHADSTFHNNDWLTFQNELELSSPKLGAFTFALDSKGILPFMYQLLVGIRCRLFDLPYGDQGFFIQESYWEKQGDFLNIPIMEDVEWITRKNAKPLHISKAKLITSGRRMKKRGWIRSAFRNWKIYYRYKKGYDLEGLANLYSK